MSEEGPITLFVLQEFRLRAPDTDGAVARIASATPGEPQVPLLTRIDDRDRVATIRAYRGGGAGTTDAAERAALEPFVSSWDPPRRYTPRVAERSKTRPAHYRMAVTESGINDGSSAPLLATGPPVPGAGPIRSSLLWIGVPIDTHAGLLVLLGHAGDAPAADPGPGEWPLPLSAQLGVRIYDSRV